MIKAFLKNLFFVAVVIVIALILIPEWRTPFNIIRALAGGIGASAFWAVVSEWFKRNYQRIKK